MTATLDNTFVDHEGETVAPGTLCWVMTTDSAPHRFRNQRVLAVYTGRRGQQQWCLLLSAGPHERPEEVGWRLRTHLTQGEIEALNLERFVNTHRGWWPTPRGADFVERCLGYWCTQHLVFHATETCPPSDQPDRFVADARIAQLEKDLADARAANAALVKDHEEFKVKASEILADEADSHDLCGVYDEIAERAGLYRRSQDHEVVVEVTYRQVVVVKARSAGYADDLVTDSSVQAGWHPDCVLAIDVEDTHNPTDVTFKVIVEPPF